ncbi:hypothetical protein TCAL_03400 [Tigriopus californicus]|uniref:Akirin n=1 Tax=Tigriopus californicus TaxID=6832 RepID=A0A553P3U3_TIGCA|nr:akirin-2-like [Tigriopus californicus]TRY72351.1 hypothetical protein TCAL_03400 [Tigriopus californicus]|eukprot:TCALIF_03400-PA protein Name:"Similar to akirin Akirin (Drosophila melanogaster)" AED:0.02 eAED:0.02 QI:302/1/1/1/1/1/3/1098/234
MACVTLKRPLEHAHPSYTPPSSEGFSHHHPHHRPPPAKRRRCVPLNQSREHSRDLYEASTSTVGSAALGLVSRPGAIGRSSGGPSPFRASPLTPEQIANNLRDELKRLRKRRQIVPQPKGCSLAAHSPPSSPEPMDDLTAMRTASQALASAGTSGVEPAPPSTAGKILDKPIFTLKQMTLICERMCQERTDQVRNEYDRILHQKLGEQYDAFVKFIDHQIQQRFNEAQLPSYLS